MNRKTYITPEVRSYELCMAGGLMDGTSGTLQSYRKQEKQTWTDEV